MPCNKRKLADLVVREVALLCLASFTVLALPATLLAQPDPTGGDPESWVESFRDQRRHSSTDSTLVCVLPSRGVLSNTTLFLMNMFADPIPGRIVAVSTRGREHELTRDLLRPQRHLSLGLDDLLESAPGHFDAAAIQVEYFGDADMLAGWTIAEESLQISEGTCDTAGTADKHVYFWPDGRDPFGLRQQVEVTLFNDGNRPLTLAVRSPAGEESRLVMPPRHGRRLDLEATQAGRLEIETRQGDPTALFSSALLRRGERRVALERLKAKSVSTSHHSISLSSIEHDLAYSSLALYNGSSSETDFVELSLREATSGRVVATTTLRVAPQSVGTLPLSTLVGTPLPSGTRLEARSAAGVLAVQGILDGGPNSTATEIIFFSQQEAHDSGAYPLPDLSRHQVLASLTNVSTEPEPARVLGQIYWDDGSYSLAPMSISAGTTRSIDFAALQRDHRPDLLGRELPRDLPNAYFRWVSDHGSQALIARTIVQPKGARDSFGFNCAGFCCPESTQPVLLPHDVTFPAGSSDSFQAGEYVHSCDGTMGPFLPPNPSYSYSSPFSWNGSTISSNSAAHQTVSFAMDGYIQMDTNCQQVNLRMSADGQASAAKVLILAADIATNRILIDLQPTTLSGNLKVTITGPTGNRTLINGPMDGGLQNLNFGNLATYSAGSSFDKVNAVWTVEGENAMATPYPYRFTALGSYLHTRYNTVLENDCTGGPVGFCHSTGTCQSITTCSTIQQATGKSDWIAEVLENGSGVHSTLGSMSREWHCGTPGGCGQRFRKVANPCPSCSNLFLSPQNTVAVSPSNSALTCGDQLFVLNVGLVTVTDNGGGLSNQQLDHYVGISGCNRTAGTIGFRPTFRLD